MSWTVLSVGCINYVCSNTGTLHAGGGIRTREPLRDRVLSPAPLTWLGNSRVDLTFGRKFIYWQSWCVVHLHITRYSLLSCIIWYGPDTCALPNASCLY